MIVVQCVCMCGHWLLFTMWLALSHQQTTAPTEAPTVAPTVTPTKAPTVAPTEAPTQAPTVLPPPQYSCDQMAYDFYVERGYGGSQATLLESQQTDLPNAIISFFIVEINNYQNSVDPTFHKNISYFTFDIPYCTENIDFVAHSTTPTCMPSLHINVPKNASVNNTCNDDFDLVTGRTRGFVYVPRDCNFSVRIRFASSNFNITSNTFGDPVGVTEPGMYTIDIRGLFLSNLQTTEAEALSNYSNEQCDGSLSGADLEHQTITTQKQMVCVGPILKCANPLEDIQPVTRYACQDPATQHLIWQVISYEPVFHSPGLFYITFCDPFDALCNSYVRMATDNGTLNATLILRSGTRRQFDSNSSNFAQRAYVLYRTDLNEYEPRLLLAPQDTHLATLLPCICGFSVDCYPNGTINLGNVSAFYNRYNVPVLVDAGIDPVLELGTPNFTLDGSRTRTVDGGNLQFLWILYSQPPGSPPVVIPNNQSATTVIDSSLFVEGVYHFVLFASDGQDVSHEQINVTVVKAFPFALITTPDLTPSFTFYHGVNLSQPSCTGVPMTGPPSSILLNGNESRAGTLDTPINQNTTLLYAWEQLSGPVLPTPPACGTVGLAYTAGLFNTSEEMAYFIPNRTGYYTFRLNVSIAGVPFNSSDVIRIFVLPEELIHENLTFPIPNYTNPPYRNISRAPGPINQFPNGTDAPTAPSAGSPTPPPTVPAVFPSEPPLGVTGILVVILIVVAVFFVFLVLLFAYIVLLPQERRSTQDRITEEDDGR